MFPETRWQQHEKNTGKTPRLPAVGAGDYLVSAFSECGMVHVGANGPQPLPWVEILAYSQATGAVRSRWELSMIRQMSSAYMDGRRAGDDEFGIPPWELEHG